MNELIITATDGIRTQSRKFKQGVTIERAMEVMEQMYESDYLGLSYTLWVNGKEYCTLES